MGSAIALAAAPFDHPALFYRDEAEYLDGVLPFVRGGLDSGDAVMVAVPAPNLSLIRAGLGPDAGRVPMHDMTVAGGNPGRILPGVLLAFAAAHPDRRVRIVGEPIWPGRTDLEYPACVQHEALINTAFQSRAGAILCPYDIARLDGDVIADARQTHPILVTGDGRLDSVDYADPTAVADRFNRALPQPPAEALSTTVDAGKLPAVRAFVTEHAQAAGLAADRITDLVLAVNELATNTLEHSAGPGELAVWADERSVICQLRDGGHISDPLAGRVPPGGGIRGRGLFLVNQLCDLVRIHTTPAATTIRVHMLRVPAA